MVVKLHYDNGASVCFDNTLEALQKIIKFYNDLKCFPSRSGRRFTVEMFYDIPDDDELPF